MRCIQVRRTHHIVSMAVVLTIGVRETREGKGLGMALGGREEAAFWQEFLRSLVRRGLRGVRLVISAAHEGLRAALSQTLSGCVWQRCRVHFAQSPRPCASRR